MLIGPGVRGRSGGFHPGQTRHEEATSHAGRGKKRKQQKSISLRFCMSRGHLPSGLRGRKQP